MAYTTGGAVIPLAVVRRERWPGGYRAKAVPLVHPGQEVFPDQPVLRIERERVVESIQSIPRLALPSMATNVEMRAVHLGLTNEHKANTQETVPSGMHGRVVGITPRGGIIIETHAAVVQGVIGAGNQVAGLLTMWYAAGVGQGPQPIPAGAILVIPGPLNFNMLRQAMYSGVVGIIASSIMPRDLEGFLAADLIEVLNSENIEQMQARLPALTLFLTEGLGSLAMSARIMNLLSQYQGSIVLLSGITSTRQGIFPELLISLPEKDIRPVRQSVQPDLSLVVGAQVHIYSGDYEGAMGVIDYLFAHQQVFASGIRARAARLRLEDGTYVVVPTILIERIR